MVMTPSSRNRLRFAIVFDNTMTWQSKASNISALCSRGYCIIRKSSGTALEMRNVVHIYVGQGRNAARLSSPDVREHNSDTCFSDIDSMITFEVAKNNGAQGN
jgi:hypothetical protein